MKELAAAMAKAFPEIEGATKDSNNPHFKTKYADLASVVEAVKPALGKHGLWFSQITHEHDGGVCVETVLTHSSGEQMSFGKLFVPASKNDAQGYGSALTYARRYSLMAAFGVAPEDDDGNAAASSAPPARNSIANDKGKRLTPEQELMLEDKIREAGVNKAQFLNSGGARDIKDVRPDQFAAAMKRLNDLIAQRPKQSQRTGEFADADLEDSVPY